MRYAHVPIGTSRLTIAWEPLASGDVPAAWSQRTDVYRFGIALCSTRDRFCRRTGRTIAGTRARSVAALNGRSVKHGGIFTSDTGTTSSVVRWVLEVLSAGGVAGERLPDWAIEGAALELDALDAAAFREQETAA